MNGTKVSSSKSNPNLSKDIQKKLPLENNTTPSKEGINSQFRNLKNSIKNLEKSSIDAFIFDLEQTLTLNLDLLYTAIDSQKNLKQDQLNFLLSKVTGFKSLLEKKNKLRKDQSDIRGKVLMDQQILEEFKRRNGENLAYYSEQIDESQENVDKKEEFINQYEKKFNEVEIYIQRQANTQKLPQFENFCTFEILGFLKNNETIMRRKNKILQDIQVIKNDHYKIVCENNELRKNNESYNNTKINESKSVEDNDKRQKLLNMLQNYTAKIKTLENNNNELKSKVKMLENKNQAISSDNMKIKENCDKGKRMANVESTINKTSQRRNSLNNNEYKNMGYNDLNKPIEIDQEREKIDIKDLEIKIKNSIVEHENRRKADQSLLINDTNIFNYESICKQPTQFNKSIFGDISRIEKK